MRESKDLWRLCDDPVWIGGVGSKDAKLKEAREDINLLELKLLKAQQSSVATKDLRELGSAEYAKARAQVTALQGQVSALSQQLRQAKDTSAQSHLADLVNNQEVLFLFHLVGTFLLICHCYVLSQYPWMCSQVRVHVAVLRLRKYKLNDQY